MNALWVWRNRNFSVSFWWELLYWMNNLCNCCLLVCRAWILPDRCVWRAVSVCSDCTNTSVVHPLLNLVSSQTVIPASFVFPIAGWVQAQCLGRAGLDPLLCTQPLSGPEIALLCLHSWHFHFTDITLCLHWPKMPTYALATRQLSSSLAISACFALQKQLGAWSWFREGFVPSHFCDSGIWEERKRKHVILQEDILEDMSDLSLASKELGCPGRAKHCPSSHDSLFLVPRDRSMVLQALGTKSCSTEGSDEARAPPASGKQQSSRGLFLWCHPGLLGNRDMAEENIALNWKGHALSSYYSISWTGLFCQKVAVAR